MNSIRFTVYGEPRPQGSARAYTYKRKTGGIGARVDHDNPNTTTWRNTVALAAMAARGAGHSPATCGIDLEIEFYLRRPKRLSAKKATPHHIKKPDIDKLLRAVGDAMTGVVFIDDSQIRKVVMVKAYTEPGDEPKVVITVRPADLALFRHIGPPLEAHQ